MVDVDSIEVVVAHGDGATLRVGAVFLKIDADQTRTDVEVKAMARAPVPTPHILWREPLVLGTRHGPRDGTRPPRRAVYRILGGVGRGGCHRPGAARRAAATLARPEPRGAWIAPGPGVRMARRKRRPSRRRGQTQPPTCRDCTQAVDTGIYS